MPRGLIGTVPLVPRGRDGDRVRVFSRNGSDWTDRVPMIAEAIARLRVKSVTLDVEGVVCRADGVSDFDRLRAAVGLGSREAFLNAFDLLELDGESMRPYESHVRRATLGSAIKRAGPGEAWAPGTRFGRN